MDIGLKIKEARLAAQLTQEQAAEALGVSRQTMSNWENNKTYPDMAFWQYSSIVEDPSKENVEWICISTKLWSSFNLLDIIFL